MKTKHLLNSLYFRGFLISIAGVIVAIFATTYTLIELHRRDVIANFDARLYVYINEMVAEISAVDTLEDVQIKSEPRFEIPLSGWYWLISSPTDQIINESNSLSGADVDWWKLSRGQIFDQAGSYQADVYDSTGTQLRLVQRRLEFVGKSTLIISVAGNTSEIQESISAFWRAAILSMFGVMLVLIVVSILVVRLILLPIHRLQLALSSVRKGDEEKLSGSFPIELEPFIQEINALITSNNKIVTRARTQAGNLAHALKIPLSILLNESKKHQGDLADTVNHEAMVIKDQVNYHLDRAQIAGRSSVIGVKTDVTETLQKMINVFEKLYQEKAIQFTLDSDPDLLFRGDVQDFEEMLGNLIDNASKWSSQHVHVKAEKVSSEEENPFLKIDVDDDGKGLEPAERDHVLQRGARLDESIPGSGLGLSIVSELVEVYDGQLHLEQSAMGGLRCTLFLPTMTES